MYVAVDDRPMMYGRLCNTGWWGDEYQRPPGLDFMAEWMCLGFGGREPVNVTKLKEAWVSSFLKSRQFGLGTSQMLYDGA